MTEEYSNMKQRLYKNNREERLFYATILYSLQETIVYST